MNLYMDAINRVCKWRAVFAGWQLGTRTKDDPESQAVRDHREATILLRVEVSALAALLVKKGILEPGEFTRQVAEESELLNKMYEERFPGVTATEFGISIDVSKASETMKGWRP